MNRRLYIRKYIETFFIYIKKGVGFFGDYKGDDYMNSDSIKMGVEKAPHRSLLKALGLTKEEMARPFIGIVNSKNDIIPGHKHLDTISDAVKSGVRLAGGVPFEF